VKTLQRAEVKESFEDSKVKSQEEQRQGERMARTQVKELTEKKGKYYGL
jgi:hypothetical protein